MKTKWMVCIALLMMAQMSFAQKNASQLYEKFKNEEGVTCVNVGRGGIMLAGLAKNTYGVKGVKVLDLEDSAASVQENFTKSCKNLELNDYEPIVIANENGKRTKIMAKMNGDYISEMLILSTGTNECCLVWLTGKINPDDVEKASKSR